MAVSSIIAASLVSAAFWVHLVTATASAAAPATIAVVFASQK